jgi:small subunit ribosomal protein S17e
MGRIKTVLVKRIGKELVKKHSQHFKADFEHNKPMVSKLAGTTSRKMRNVVAGYVTRLMKTR